MHICSQILSMDLNLRLFTWLNKMYKLGMLSEASWSSKSHNHNYFSCFFKAYFKKFF